MPYSKNLEKYPQDFLLLSEVPDSRLPLVLTFNTPKAASAWRFKVYGFIEAMRHAKHPGVHRLDSLLIRTQGPLVIIELRDLQDAGALIELRQAAAESAMVTPPPDAVKAPYKSHMEAMMEKEMAEYHAQQQAKKAQPPASVASSPPKAIAPIDTEKK